MSSIVRDLRFAVRSFRRSPGLTLAALLALPLSGGAWFLTVGVEGRPAPPPQEAPSAGVRFVTPGYLEALKTPLVAGRRITGADPESVAAGVRSAVRAVDPVVAFKSE